jgi:hypothetical protein
LKGWSIATGWKNLYNHPITEDFEIKAGKKKEITKDFSKFTLNNKQTKIELRYPDGEVAYKLKYKKDKISDDEIYAKVDSKWQWIAPAKTKTEITDAEDVTTDPTQEENSVSVPETTEPATAPEPQTEEIPEEIIGKFSKMKNQQQDIETKILGFKNSKTNPNITSIYASTGQPFVLGISTARTNSPAPQLTQELFSKKLFTKINLFLNNFIYSFGN